MSKYKVGDVITPYDEVMVSIKAVIPPLRGYNGRKFIIVNHEGRYSDYEVRTEDPEGPQISFWLGEESIKGLANGPIKLYKQLL